MPKIKVYFSDGSVQTFHEEQTFKTFVFSDDGWERFDGSKVMNVKSQDNIGLRSKEDGSLIDSLFEILANSDYFCDVENPDIIYSKNAIVKFEMI